VLVAIASAAVGLGLAVRALVAEERRARAFKSPQSSAFSSQSASVSAA
jgi:hypothetical protein